MFCFFLIGIWLHFSKSTNYLCSTVVIMQTKKCYVFAFSRPVRLHFSLESWMHCNTSIEFNFYAFVHEYFDFHDYNAVYINTLYNFITAIID